MTVEKMFPAKSCEFNSPNLFIMQNILSQPELVHINGKSGGINQDSKLIEGTDELRVFDIVRSA